MAYIGKTPVIGNFVKLDSITVVNGQAAYTMQNGGVNFTSYDNVNQFLVSLNGILQSPGTSFSVASSTLTFASNLSTGDVIDFVLVLGNSLDIGTPSDNTVTAAKLNNDIISGSTELASEPADTDEFLVSDAGTIKRIDYSLIKSSPSMILIKETNASNVSAVTFQDGTDSVVFDSTYKVYFLTFTNILLASDEELFLRVLSGGSVQSGSTAYWTGQFGTSGTPALPSAYNDRYENALWGSPGDVESTIPLSGYVYIYNVGQSSSYPQAMGQIFMQRSNGNPYGMGFSGYYKTAISNFDGITLTNNGGGNISSGNFKLYGIT